MCMEDDADVKSYFHLKKNNKKTKKPSASIGVQLELLYLFNNKEWI